MSTKSVTLPPITLDGTSESRHSTLRVTVHDSALIESLTEDVGLSLEDALAESVPDELDVHIGPHGVEIFWLNPDGSKRSSVGLFSYGGRLSATVWDQMDPENEHPLLDLNLRTLSRGFTGFGAHARRQATRNEPKRERTSV